MSLILQWRDQNAVNMGTKTVEADFEFVETDGGPAKSRHFPGLSRLKVRARVRVQMNGYEQEMDVVATPPPIINASAARRMEIGRASCRERV